MSSSNFKILKQCTNCGNMFEAQRITTKYCSLKCNAAHYKLKKRQEIKGKAESEIIHTKNFKPIIPALKVAAVKDKEFLNVREVAFLFGCSKPTIYSLIKSGKVKTFNLHKKKTMFKRSTIDKLFD